MIINEDNNQDFSDENPETNYIIDPISNKKEELIYGLYSKLETYLHHYNNMQNKCKKIAFTWVLATFIGISYVISGKEKGLPINPFLTISLLCFLSSLGIIFIWFLDTGIYQKLLRAIFIENEILEKKHAFLGKNYSSMYKLLHRKGDPVISHGTFYSTFIIILLLLASFGLFNYISFTYTKLYAFIFAGFVFFILIIFKYLHHKLTLKSGYNSKYN
jgi:hypothetical protein